MLSLSYTISPIDITGVVINHILLPKILQRQTLNQGNLETILSAFKGIGNKDELM